MAALPFVAVVVVPVLEPESEDDRGVSVGKSDVEEDERACEKEGASLEEFERLFELRRRVLKMAFAFVDWGDIERGAGLSAWKVTDVSTCVMKRGEDVVS